MKEVCYNTVSNVLCSPDHARHECELVLEEEEEEDAPEPEQAGFDRDNDYRDDVSGAACELKDGDKCTSMPGLVGKGFDNDGDGLVDEEDERQADEEEEMIVKRVVVVVASGFA